MRRITGYMYSIQASASLRILYILLHFYHYVIFSFKFGIHFATLSSSEQYNYIYNKSICQSSSI